MKHPTITLPILQLAAAFLLATSQALDQTGAVVEHTNARITSSFLISRSPEAAESFNAKIVERGVAGGEVLKVRNIVRRGFGMEKRDDDGSYDSVYAPGEHGHPRGGRGG